MSHQGSLRGEFEAAGAIHALSLSSSAIRVGVCNDLAQRISICEITIQSCYISSEQNGHSFLRNMSAE
jgi:hypothetical protein